MATYDQNDLLLGLGVLGTASLALFVVIPAGVDPPANVPIRALAPDFWPQVVSVFLALVGALIALQAVFARRAGQKSAASVDESPTHSAASESGGAAVWRGLATFALLFGYYWLLQPVGFVAASVVAILGLCLLSGERRYGYVLAVAVLLPVSLYYVFTHLASVSIPLGFFEDWP